MKRHTTFSRWIAFIVLMTIISAPALAAAPAAAPAVTDDQKAKLDNIDKCIEQQKQNINYNYEIWKDEIRAKRADETRLLEIINPDLYVRGGFTGWANYVANSLELRGIDMKNDPQFAETFHNLYSTDDGFTAIQKFQLEPRLLAIAEERYAREENRTLRGYKAAELRLEQERKYALDVELAQYAEQLKNNALNPPKAKPVPAGQVAGILYSSDKSAAIVGSQIVHNGDKLDSVKVVKITPDAVEFDKNGRTWTQKVGEAPSSMW